MANSEFLEVQENGLSIGLASPAPEILLTPNIGVIGVGGAGGNAINNMVMANLGDVAFYAANTDAQALSKSLVADRIQLGITITQGLGAGANPEVGKAAATEAEEKIKEYIKGLHLLFITAGMGGGTGTGAAPVIARIAKDLGILTIGVVSKPFQFEGAKRMKTAKAGIEELKKYVDTLIVIPNQNLFRIIAANTTFIEAFKIADDVLCQGVRSITDLIINSGNVNLDFADLKTVLSAKGRSIMSTGEASGENRAEISVEKAIFNPLLDDSSIKGAKSILINISSDSDLTLSEVDLAVSRINQELDDDQAEIYVGTRVDETLQGKMRVSLVATGIDEDYPIEKYVAPKSVVKETVVEVPVSEESEIIETKNENIEEITETEENFSFVQDMPPVENMMKNELQNPYGFFSDFGNDDSNYDNIAIDITEKPIEQPLLIDDEQPIIQPAIPIVQIPDVKEELNTDAQKVTENVKPVPFKSAGRSFVDKLLNRDKTTSMSEQPTMKMAAKSVQTRELLPNTDSKKDMVEHSYEENFPRFLLNP